MKKYLSILLALAMLVGLAACGGETAESGTAPEASVETAASVEEVPAEESSVPQTEDSVAEKEDSSAEEVQEPSPVISDQAYIEETLNLKNNPEQTWFYSADGDAWTLDVVSAVVYPELPEQQGVSVCVPGAYVAGIDTDGDGKEDVLGADAAEGIQGSLVINYEAEITSTNGQIYTAKTAPVIVNTGAAGYGSQSNSQAGSGYAGEGYINVVCGNRGKQDFYTDENGETVYTGDAPSCLVDQKNAVRFVKYNILLGNLPGSVDYFVTTGGSGGGAHAAMFAATSNNPDFYDYEIKAGAVGVYECADGSYSTTVTIDGVDYALSDGAWGCVAYSAITSLGEADMAMAMEYYMDVDYDFNTPFQKQLAAYLSETYMEYINGLRLVAVENQVGFDLNGDGDMEDEIPMTIECDPEQYPETNGYYGTYLDLWLMEFQSNLQWYVDSLGYAEDWTWFGSDGSPMSDDEVAAMTDLDRTEAFLEGRYAKSYTGFGGPGGMGGPMGPPPGGMPMDMMGGPPGMVVGTPDAGTTQASGSGINSSNYGTFEEMMEAYAEDIAEVQNGDEFGKNIAALYNPVNYIGAEGTENPTWTRILMGAAEGDLAMMNSLNLQLHWLEAGTDADIAWQWDGGHVPSEILGDSLPLYVDMMYGKYVDGAVKVEKPEPKPQTTNGTDTEASGTDISSWVQLDGEGKVSFTLADAAAYRVAGAAKAVPGFDVIDYGQEDYVFGSLTKDARHWNSILLDIFEKYADVLSPLFNQE
ncbi:MAG: hypothetical protein PUC06_05590 [Oscillospiraceae bacterium]|nr:hypothetical protein [Oscillospiraceae bacterium]